jgi:hypothetical protein
MSTSIISWLDFSESERRKAIEVIALFEDRETRDELGLGTIRDGFANDFFPGTTTLQTRARYFLLVPWLYQYYEHKHFPTHKVKEYLRWDETKLIETLKNAGEAGVIGQRSGASLRRFPSNIYWIGMQTWGICRFPGTQDQYHRSLSHHYVESRKPAHVEEEQQILDVMLNWDPNLPGAPENFSRSTSLSLTLEEAEYLRECLRLTHPDSLLSYLIEYTQPVDEDIRSPWFHPQWSNFPNHLKEKLVHARNFSDSMYGAALLYNYLLFKKRNETDRTDEYRNELKNWRQQMLLRTQDWTQWDRIAFWSLARSIGRIPAATERFVNEWLNILFNERTIASPVDNSRMQLLIEDRERRLKGSRSRFTSPRHLTIWKGDAGTGQLEFRWRVARRIINDILDGLANNGSSNHAGT